MGLPEPPASGVAMLPCGTFTDDVVVVTGGGTGLGKAIAAEFGRLGGAVGILSRNPDHHRAGVEAVEQAGGRAIGVVVDVRDTEAVNDAFEQIDRELGAPTVLINNAAGNFAARAEDLSIGGWRAVTQIVLDGTFVCSAELARRRIARGGGGAICNIAATYAWTGGPGTAHSAAAKAGVVSLTQSLAVEWASHGIRVNGLAPGLFLHDDIAPHMRSKRSEAEAGSSVPAGRTGRARELGWAATYLCSPYAAYVTGHTLVVDGGNWLRRGLRMPEFISVAEQLSEDG